MQTKRHAQRRSHAIHFIHGVLRFAHAPACRGGMSEAHRMRRGRVRPCLYRRVRSLLPLRADPGPTRLRHCWKTQLPTSRAQHHSLTEWCYTWTTPHTKGNALPLGVGSTQGETQPLLSPSRKIHQKTINNQQFKRLLLMLPLMFLIIYKKRVIVLKIKRIKNL